MAAAVAAAAAFRAAAVEDSPAVVAVSAAAEQEGVGHGEDGRRQPDAEGERENRKESDPRRTTEASAADPDVLEQRVHRCLAHQPALMPTGADASAPGRGQRQTPASLVRRRALDHP